MIHYMINYVVLTDRRLGLSLTVSKMGYNPPSLASS